VNYEYDVRNLVTKATGSQGVLAQYSYDAHGNLTGVQYADGTSYTFSYDQYNQLLNAEEKVRFIPVDRNPTETVRKKLTATMTRHLPLKLVSVILPE
jgi:YD repeat-containing protein